MEAQSFNRHSAAMSNSVLPGKSEVHHPNLQALFESVPGQFLILLPDFTMVEASDAYLYATMKTREQIIGHNLFEVFPDNPLDIAARGMDNLRVSLSYVLKHGVPHLMEVQKYDMRTPEGKVEERYWSLYNKPVFNSKDELIYIIHRVEDVTRQVQADLKVKAGEELISLIIDNVKEYALFMLDADGFVTSWNRGAEHIKGYKAAEIIGKHISVFYTDEEVRDRTPDRNLKMAKESRRLEVEGWRKRKDGSQFWAEVVLTALYNDDGSVRAISKITRDITERNNVKEQIKELNATLEQRVIERTNELFESEKKYHNLFQNNPMPMWVIDVETFQFLDVNDAAVRHYGFSREEFLNMTALDIRPEEERERYIQANRTEDSGPLNVGIWKHYKKDGSLIYIEGIVHYITFEGKRARLVLSNDVTEKKIAEDRHKKAEEKILASEVRFRSLIEKNNDMMTLTSPEGKILYASPSITNVMGYSSDEFLKISVFDLVPPDDLVGLWEQIQSIMEFPGKSFYREQRLQHKSGHYIWTEGTMTNMLHEPSVSALVSNFREITERKNAELHRNKITADLIQRNKDLEQFAYILSHNLRLPVANILGLSQALQDEALDVNDIPEIAKGLHASTQKLDEVILDLNNILKVRSEIIEKKEQVILSELVADIRHSLDGQIKKDNIDFLVDFSEVDEMRTLKSYLHSILYNLISNSIKYRKTNDNCRIEIKSRKTPGGLRLLIRDNGIGMDLQKMKNNLFGLYKRFHPEVEGRGVGLFMVKTQVEALGATINVKSKINEGTEFIIDFESTD